MPDITRRQGLLPTRRENFLLVPIPDSRDGGPKMALKDLLAAAEQDDNPHMLLAYLVNQNIIMGRDNLVANELLSSKRK
jgi:hypothetical protein